MLLVWLLLEMHMFKIVSLKYNVNPDLKKRLGYLKREIRRVVKERKIKSRWEKLLRERREIVRDYNLSIQIDVASRVSWRVWGEKKRHRTVPMTVDSIYFSV